MQSALFAWTLICRGIVLLSWTSAAVLLWRPLMNTSTQSILEMFSWRHSVTKRWPRKSLDINTGPRESCAALHVWGWASSAETAAGRGAVLERPVSAPQPRTIGSGVRDVARLQLGYMRVPAGSSSATSQA